MLLGVTLTASLREMGKLHKHLVKGTETDRVAKRNHIHMLMDVLQTLWLKCSTVEFTFFGQSLTGILNNISETYKSGISKMS